MTPTAPTRLEHTPGRKKGKGKGQRETHPVAYLELNGQNPFPKPVTAEGSQGGSIPTCALLLGAEVTFSRKRRRGAWCWATCPSCHCHSCWVAPMCLCSRWAVIHQGNIQLAKVTIVWASVPKHLRSLRNH